MEFTLRHPYPLEAFLGWRPAIEAADEAAYRRVLADPSFRTKLKEESASTGVPNRFSDKTWPHLTIMEVTRPEHRHLQGQTIGALAEQSGRHPFDVFLDFGLDGELDAMFDCRLFNTDEDEVRKLLRHPQRRGRALRRRRAPVVPLRRRLRPAPVRPLGARAGRPHAGGGGEARDQRRGVGLSHPRSAAAWRPARGPT